MFNSKKLENAFVLYMQSLPLRGVIWGGPSPPQGKRKKERKKEKIERKEKKEKKKKGTMNSVKLLHNIKCCFSNFSIVRWHWKILKKFGPQEKVEMTPCCLCHTFVPFLLLYFTRASMMTYRISSPMCPRHLPYMPFIYEGPAVAVLYEKSVKFNKDLLYWNGVHWGVSVIMKIWW